MNAWVVGAYNPMDKEAGFVLPVFECVGVQSCQVITSTAHISHFFPIQFDDLCAEVTAANVAQLSDILDPAIFAFLTPRGLLVSGTRQKLIKYLFDTMSDYEYDPTLLYEVAQFVADRQLIGRAADLAATTLQHSRLHAGTASEYANQIDPDFNYNMFFLFSEVLIDHNELKAIENNIQDIYPLIKKVRKDARSGAPILAATGDLNGWHFMEAEEQVRETRFGTLIDFYVRYFFNEYSESRVISDASDDSIANKPYTPGIIWQKLRRLLATSVHMAVFE